MNASLFRRCGWFGLVSLALALVPIEASVARDLGTIGPVYPVAEPDMLEQIEQELRAKQASGELGRLREAGQRQVQASVQTPQPVSGLRSVQVARAWHFDPSVKFDEPVLDDKGRVIVPAGTVANPLDVVSLRSVLFLFDGRDPKQVALARAEIASAEADRVRRPLTLILVGGTPLALAAEWKRPVYFDQGGRTVQRLGLSAVPARVRQDGRLLLVEEVPAP